MYEFIGPREGPARQLVTNMNFHASDVCIGMATSFVTIANLTRETEPSECEEGALFSFPYYCRIRAVHRTLQPVALPRSQSHLLEPIQHHVQQGRAGGYFVQHAVVVCAIPFPCRKHEIECVQDGIPFFDSYSKHVPSVQHTCFSFSSRDFYTRKNGTRNVRISDDGCDDYDDYDDAEEL